MSEKTYTTPGKREPELVIVPMGAVNQAGVKQKRKAIKFFTNSRGVGQFTTSDKGLQDFIEAHPWTKSDQIICVGEASMATPEEAPEEAQASGPATSAEPVRKGGRPRKNQ
jgi:hypothetical protein